MVAKNVYRTHTCGELRKEDCGKRVRISGWVHRNRDHGQVFFIDLRDHYGIVQCVFEPTHAEFERAKALALESVVTIEGEVVPRSPGTVNASLATGEIEIVAQDLHLLSKADPLPMPVNSEAEFPEETRLKYRFLDLRRSRIHQNIVLRSQIITSLRKRMIEQDFVEFQTPILTASSPEGARDYLVPSRFYPGEFYALPQAPQQFKQLLMVAGFDRYFQIAPCFRDEDARADRSPGEFYQLDFEMAFVTQEDVWNTIEPVIYGIFSEFSKEKFITPFPFPKLAYKETCIKYGTDKPDLRNPLIIHDVTNLLKDIEFAPFQEILAHQGVIRAIPVPNSAQQSRSFFKELTQWASEQGANGLGYILLQEGEFKGPLAKFLSNSQKEALRRDLALEEHHGLFFICDQTEQATIFSGKLRIHLGKLLNLIDPNQFLFCWITDFPMYEKDPETGKICFSHNPFSMPQGGMDALLTQDPLTINAYQYDLVCNGIELSSGAIRNHNPEVMYKAFELAGYGKEEVEKRFGALLRAFHYGSPPHGGLAPGIDRIVMLLANEANIREIIAFPFNQQVRDVLMEAPSSISPERLKELYLSVMLPNKK